ncbi:1351_t:CDS:2 [Acaulospora colombiana]|uniref:1351_t:CDS:1 n=1 Tax=Acaulospora colombiana TaxID=27376 RepID=A0ACA9N2A6_9GLOM|nr:1351_t:CDS:2 [Acaulospora colombiana]
MSVEVAPFPLAPSGDAAKMKDFGRVVKDVHPGKLTPEQLEEVKELLYKHGALLFPNVVVTPEEQYALTKVSPVQLLSLVPQDLRLTNVILQAFDPSSENYGHGNNKTGNTQKSILHPDLKTIPRVPQVQLIGNGTVYDHEGLAEAKLKHPHHKTFHADVVSEEDEKKGVTRFYRWHIDAALYDLDPPKVTTLYGLKVPGGSPQVVRYDDGTGDELKVPLGTTAFVCGATMFDILPPELKSVAVRAKVRYAPHPYVWMAPARSNTLGLGLLTENKELPLSELPEWSEEKVKLWKNPVTGKLHYQVHPSGAFAIEIAPLPEKASKEGALYPDGANITDLKEVRDLLYKMQRPGIAPPLVKENDFVLFHNRGVLHTVVGAFTPDQVRAFHQPVGPTEEDVLQYA